MKSPVNRSPNKSQLEAIKATEGPVLIIAGPGSGKTFTLIERIIKLITDKSATPESMMVVTFTDKAAREIETRISNRLAELNILFNLHEMYVGTFHGICLRFIEEYREHTRLKRNFILLEPFDQQYLIFQKWWSEFKDIEGIDTLATAKPIWEKALQISNYINKISEEALDINELSMHEDITMRALAASYKIYQNELESNNALDFGGMQQEFYNLLNENDEIANTIKNKLNYIMVDEYQDTNTIQELILNKLLNSKNNICVVGDDDQGLYRFRGATIRNIFEFPNKFKNIKCHQVKLETNYRSHPEIIGYYNQWMASHDWSSPANKTFRYPKVIKPRKDIFPKTPAVITVSADNLDEWPIEIFTFLKKLKKEGLKDWNQVAFLFRSVNNPNVKKLSVFLEDNNIPVYSPRSNMFFDRREIKLIIGAFLSIFPNYKIIRQGNSEYVNPVWEYYDIQCENYFKLELSNKENKKLAAHINELASKHLNLHANTSYAFTNLFYDLLSFPLFADFLNEESMKGPDKGRAQRNLSKFSSFLSKFQYLHNISNIFIPKYFDNNIKRFFNDYLPYIKDGGINEYEDDEEYAPSGCISFLTIHQSKGLEYPVVIVGSLWDKLNNKSDYINEFIDENVLNDEPFEPKNRISGFDFKRLYYTAFSRAQNLLVLSWGSRPEGPWPIPGKEFLNFLGPLHSWDSSQVNFKSIKFEPVKKINIKKQYSFTSDILVYEKCPERYRLYKELEFTPAKIFPMLFGNLVHQTIEDIHKAVIKKENDISQQKVENWFETNYELLSKSTRVSLSQDVKSAALNHVLNYLDRENSTWSLIRDAEIEISLVKPNYVLVGSVDLLRGTGDTVEIIDFKSEEKPSKSSSENLEQYQRQLEIYAHLVEGKVGKKVSKMHLYYTGTKNNDPYISFDRVKQSINKTVKAFDNVVNCIESKDYSMDSRPIKVCEQCDFKGYCNNKWQKKV